VLSKFLVRLEAKRILKGLRRLDTSEDIVDDLARWRRAATSLIKEVYGEDSDLLKELHWPGWESAYSYGKVIQVIEDFLSTIQSTGLPFGYRAPKRNMILSHLATALVFILATLVGVYATHWLNQSGQSQAQFGGRENESYKVTKAEFDHWYRNLRWQYQQGRDSVTEEVRRTAGRGLVHSMTLKKRLEYAEKFERQTDKTLDSFLMEYAIQGGDTLTLEYKRKPLGNLSQDLRNSPAYKR